MLHARWRLHVNCGSLLLRAVLRVNSEMHNKFVATELGTSAQPAGRRARVFCKWFSRSGADLCAHELHACAHPFRCSLELVSVVKCSNDACSGGSVSALLVGLFQRCETTHQDTNTYTHTVCIQMMLLASGVAAGGGDPHRSGEAVPLVHRAQNRNDLELTPYVCACLCVC